MTGEVKYHDLAFVGGVRLWLCSKFTFRLIFESIKNDVFCVYECEPFCARRIPISSKNFILFRINIHLSYKNNNICCKNYASSLTLLLCVCVCVKKGFTFICMRSSFTLICMHTKFPCWHKTYLCYHVIDVRYISITLSCLKGCFDKLL